MKQVSLCLQQDDTGRRYIFSVSPFYFYLHTSYCVCSILSLLQCLSSTTLLQDNSDTLKSNFHGS